MRTTKVTSNMAMRTAKMPMPATQTIQTIASFNYYYNNVIHFVKDNKK